VMWSTGPAGSCASNAGHSMHRRVLCDENQSESRMPEIGTSGCVSSEGWCVQQEINLPGQESGAP
jgi:hypothetical protein